MTPWPARMADRWRGRAEPGPGQAQLYWHILMSDQPQVRALAAVARQRLAAFAGLHFTPEQRLHLSLLRVGLTTEISAEAIGTMVDRTRSALRPVSPPEFTLGRVLYHPEAIVLGVQPDGALGAISAAVREAAATAQGLPAEAGSRWIPHVTVAYSTADQEAGPIIAALGHELPECPVTVDAIHLIAQHGAERAWNWQSLARVAVGS
jgi:2'-5' RNA ligase